MNFDWFNTFLYVDSEILIRLVVSLALGLVIGFERELISKSAGLRTQTLVCLGSTIFTLISLYGFEPRMNPDGSFVPADPARVAAQIVTGVGFIGGGVVLKSGVSVHGITTAASLWMSAAIGMAAGCGNFSLAVLGTVLAVVVLIPLGFFEKRFLSKIQKKESRLKVDIQTTLDKLEYTNDFIRKHFNNILEINIINSKTDENSTQLSFVFEMLAVNPSGKVYGLLKNLEGYQAINVKVLVDQ